MNVITPEIDGSQIYGSTDERTATLRTFEGGLLGMGEDPTSPFGLLETTRDGLQMAGDNDPDNPLFLAGDIRANENTGLTVMHTLMQREHNHWAKRLGEGEPGLDGRTAVSGCALDRRDGDPDHHLSRLAAQADRRGGRRLRGA